MLNLKNLPTIAKAKKGLVDVTLIMMVIWWFLDKKY